MPNWKPYLKLTGSTRDIYFAFENKSFNLQRLAQLAPTGIDYPPEERTVGPNTVYYYGPGGGGVEYPDRFFFNVKGKTLTFLFDGPYDDGSKTPDESTKRLEPIILETLRTF